MEDGDVDLVPLVFALHAFMDRDDQLSSTLVGCTEAMLQDGEYNALLDVFNHVPEDDVL